MNGSHHRERPNSCKRNYIYKNEPEKIYFNNNIKDDYLFNSNIKNNIQIYNIFDLDRDAPKPKLNKLINSKDMAFRRINNNKYSKEIEILINLYLFEKKKFNLYLNENLNTKFYIIDKSWLSDYKSFYDYQNLQDYLSNKNVESMNNGEVEKEIFQLQEYYEAEAEIYKKEYFKAPSINSHQYKELTKKTEKKNYKLLINYVIIDYKLFSLFNSNKIIEIEIQKINNNQFFISFNNTKYDSQLGYFNLNEFIPQYFFDYNRNYFDTLINLIKTENFILFMRNENNFCALDTGYCFKVINANNQRDTNKEIDILYLLRELRKKNINLDLKILSHYTCINCDSEIEITNINICNNEKQEQDIIEYNCYCCPKKNKQSKDAFQMDNEKFHFKNTLKEYLNKMIINTYLYNKCCVCGSNQIDKIINNINNIFKFCLKCQKIFCNNTLCLSFHKCQIEYFIDIRQKNNICLNLSHFDLFKKTYFFFSNYCIESKKNICDNCFKIDHKGHLNDKRILNYNNEQKEKELLLKIISKLEEDKKKITNEKILNENKKINESIQKLEKQLKDEIEKNNKNKENELTKIEKQFEIDIKQNEKIYDEQITNYMKNLYEEMNSLIIELNNYYREQENKSDGNVKFKILDSYFSDNQKISKEYNNIINNCKYEYERKIENIKKLYNSTKTEINKNFQKKNEEAKKKYEKAVREKNNNFEKQKERIINEVDNPLKNRIDYQIIFINILLNAYNLKEDTNYYYSKNLFNLLYYFYNNENSDIYKNVLSFENIDEFKKIKNKIVKNDNDNYNTNDIIFNNQNHANYNNINIVENEHNKQNNSDFILLDSYNKDDLNNSFNQNDNNFNNIKIINEYTYKLMTKRNDLTKNATINDKYINFEIMIINDSKNYEWPPNGRTKLISDEKSDLKITPILLEGTKPNSLQQINICCDLNNNNPGTKQCILNFNVDGKNYGEQIILIVNINEDLIQKFRDEFSLSKEDFPDEKLLNALKNNDNNFYKSFESFFN